MMNCWRQIGLVLVILTCAFGVTRAQQPHPPLEYAGDLAALGNLASVRGTPIMLVFTRPDCPYCARAKKDHLEPLRANPDYGAKVMLREIVTSNDVIALRDFDGTPTTHRDFARKHQVRMVPTVMVVDARGALLAEPIVGLNVPDFYNLYLEQAIDAARVQLSARNRQNPSQ